MPLNNIGGSRCCHAIPISTAHLLFVVDLAAKGFGLAQKPELL